MNNGAFGENFPYSNFHDLNMDWIIQIAKDFLDQYTHIQEIISTGEQNIIDLTASGLDQLQEKADNLEELLQAWYDTHSEEIADQLADALADLNTWYNEHITQINTELNRAVASFQTQASARATATLESIPSDYTTLYNEVQNLQYILNQIAPYYPNANLANPLNTVVGMIWVDGVIDSSQTDFYSTDFIKIDPNSHYTLSVWKNGRRVSTRRRVCALYDSNHDYIADSRQTEINVEVMNISTGSTARYIRLSANNGFDLYLLKGTSTPQSYVNYGQVFFVAYKEEINLFNNLDAVSGFLYETGGIGSSTLYYTSAFIEVKRDFTYNMPLGARRINFYRTTESTSIYQSIDSNSHNMVSVVAPISGFMRFTIWTEDLDLATCYSTFDGKATQKLEEGVALSNYQMKEAREIVISDMNIFNKNNAVQGVLYTTGGITPSDQYYTSEYIEVVQGLTYHMPLGVRRLNYYKTTIQNSIYESLDTDSHDPQSYTSPINGFMRFSLWAEDLDNASCYTTFEGNVTQKLKEGISLSNYQKLQTHKLFGKKWAVCGDSFTAGGGTGTILTEGKYAGHNYTYPWIIGNRTGIEIYNFSEGGRTLAYPEEPYNFENSLTNPNANWYYRNIPSDTDYITIYLGINDEHHATGDNRIPIGTVDDNTTNTYLGAWNVVLKWLIQHRPNAHIGMIVTNGIQGHDNYRQGQIAIANKYGIPYIDLNGDSRTPAMIRTSNPNIPASVKQLLINKWSIDYPTNTHPNDACQLYESTFIEAFLESL